jgi:L-asparaginase/Glu-tRNA(Gln) amidotransferase subunit D
MKVIESICMNSQAVVIQAYGMGNIPSNNQSLLEIIQKAIDKGVIIVIMTQCHEGGVNDLYETGRALVNMGAVLGNDMTIECCLSKLSYLFGKKYSIEKVKKMMMQSLRGELNDIRKH